MSRSVNQAMVQLYVLAGCFNSLLQTNSFARVDVKQSVKEGVEDCLVAIRDWPGVKITRRDQAWIHSHKEVWKEYVQDLPDEAFHSAALVKMCGRLASALDELTNNRTKRRLLAPVVEAAEALDYFVDPEGKNFPAYEKADELLAELYQILEMPEYA